MTFAPRITLLLMCLTLPIMAAAQSVQTVTTAGGVQRLATTVADRSPVSMTIPQPMPQYTVRYTAPQAAQPVTYQPTRHYSAPRRQPSASQRITPMTGITRIPGNVTSNAINTVARTTEQQLNWQINSTVRRELRNIIQF